MFNYLIWDMAGKMGVQFVSLALSILLTRLLSPAAFGIMGIAMVIIFIASVFLDMGFGRALVQRKEVSQPEYSSVFVLNLFLGFLLASVCYLLASPLANYYHHPGLRNILKILSLLFLINSITLVPGAILVRQMKFKTIALIGLISAALSGLLSILMAWKGYGIWSLVAQYLCSASVTAILYFYVTGWRPRFQIRKTLLAPLWNYGSRMFSSSLLNTIVTRLDVFIIGKLYPIETMGYYARAQSLDSVVRQLSMGSLSAVFFPASAQLQNERTALLILYKRYLHLVAFFAIGLAGLFYLVVPDLFTVFFTANWDTAAKYFQLMCVAGFTWPVSAIMVGLIAGVGNSKAHLQLEFIKMGLLAAAYAAGIANGIIYFLWIMVAVRVLSVCCNAVFVSRELQISTGQQLSIVMLYLLQGLAAVLITVFCFHYLNPGERWVRIILLFAGFGILYLMPQFIIGTKAGLEMKLLYRRIILKK